MYFQIISLSRDYSIIRIFKNVLQLCGQICILIDMNKTANLYARIEPDVKEQAESVLETLGISVSSAINMFYK